MEFLVSILKMIENIRELNLDPSILFIVLCFAVVFGALNCFLGYRLIRFWMMVGGIVIGAVGGYFLCGPLDLTGQNQVVLVSAVCGILCGVIAFFIYIVGIFAAGVALGLTTSIYFLHPTTSSVFFACLMVGLLLGIFCVKFSRGVIITVTSLSGGVIMGLAITRLFALPLWPHGLGICLAVVVLGFLVQFFTNPVRDEEDDDGYDEVYERPQSEAHDEDFDYEEDE